MKRYLMYYLIGLMFFSIALILKEKDHTISIAALFMAVTYLLISLFFSVKDFYNKPKNK